MAQLHRMEHQNYGRQYTLGMEPTNKAIPDPRNQLNNLTNTEWMFFTRNVWITNYPNDVGFELRKKQGGNKPPRLMKDIIAFFTKKEQKILDPMNGVGATLLGCALSGREGVGIELNSKWIDIYREVCKQEGLKQFNVLKEDCLEGLITFDEDEFDLVCVDPPYREDVKWDRTMCNAKHVARIANLPERYSESTLDFGNVRSYSEFLAKIFKLAQEVKRVLKQERYFIVFCKDEYQNGEFIEKSSALADIIREAGFQWKAKITWYQAGAKLRPYGVPYSFVPNITDQKILVFKKSTRIGRNRLTQKISEIELNNHAQKKG